jgi:surface polysaccharide O-acyltransferase-like enzyme
MGYRLLNAEITANFCAKSASIWQIVGYLFFILKVIIPLIIIILGMIDFAQAVIANDDKTIAEKSIRLIKRIIIGVVIFFIPTLVRVIFFMLPMFNQDMKNDTGNCITCLTSPKDCDTSYQGGTFSK